MISYATDCQLLERLVNARAGGWDGDALLIDKEFSLRHFPWQHFPIPTSLPRPLPPPPHSLAFLYQGVWGQCLSWFCSFCPFVHHFQFNDWNATPTKYAYAMPLLLPILPITILSHGEVLYIFPYPQHNSPFMITVMEATDQCQEILSDLS